MICKVLDDKNYIIKVFKEYNDFDIYDHNEIKEFVQELFDRLLKKYNINGNILFNIYIDNLYGMIIYIKKDSNSFIKIKYNLNISFLYEVDYFYLVDNNITNQNIYYYNDKFYLEIVSYLSKADYLKLLDNALIIYNDMINEIINNAIKIKI